MAKVTEEKKQWETRNAPRVTEDGAVVYRAPYTTITMIVPAVVVKRLANGRKLTEGVLWEIAARAKAEGTVLFV